LSSFLEIQENAVPLSVEIPEIQTEFSFNGKQYPTELCHPWRSTVVIALTSQQFALRSKAGPCVISGLSLLLVLTLL